ncbi:hypothetical protein CDAR_436981 [Caerostris darwini]|uniref:Uncharacterized protein n=1 Tax=Caerostris darwini TaxID=1538125 RepID=A0AAV4TWB2_9ARAC|nr:hypothetical protein CDAR_436981 [Caerostris darwini]
MQCLNCNHIHHSLSPTNPMRECGEEHITSACHIKDKLINLKYINYGEHGHVASRRVCKAFPKEDKEKKRNKLSILLAQSTNSTESKFYRTQRLPHTEFQDISYSTVSNSFYAEVPGSSDLITPFLLLKELQCIMDVFKKYTDAIKNAKSPKSS